MRNETAGDDREPILRGGDDGHLALDFVMQPFVVVVEEGDPVAAGRVHAGIARDAAAGDFRQDDDTEARVGDHGEARGGGRIGSVDDHDDFEVSPGLAQRAANGAGDQLGTAARGNDGGNQ